MTINVQGNSGRSFLGERSSGIGIMAQPVGQGWVGITASAANDTWITPLNGLTMGDINQGIYFQSTVDVEITFTLCNVAAAVSKDPGMVASVPWGNSITVSPGTIIPADVLFTACKAVFSGPGELYIGVR